MDAGARVDRRGDGHDLRVLALRTTWFGVHHASVNADRLVRFVPLQGSARVRAFWAAW